MILSRQVYKAIERVQSYQFLFPSVLSPRFQNLICSSAYVVCKLGSSYQSNSSSIPPYHKNKRAAEISDMQSTGQQIPRLVESRLIPCSLALKPSMNKITRSWRSTFAVYSQANTESELYCMVIGKCVETTCSGSFPLGWYNLLVTEPACQPNRIKQDSCRCFRNKNLKFCSTYIFATDPCT